ncbi:TrbI/VirB10 family protein [Erythrobacter sp. THAF29]|uniref:TrbI/VirB10 family protein n=1 Tax=Erythrobacter sp. THAF29 TaxID=2587851 RepID=UPI00126879B2|nr:TrbI/VirB10 family protein [Erythrobacter sp. THAF29]QFT78516.1 Type IV secretion system protein virB10 [Erythrobacter sp. THAF29]
MNEAATHGHPEATPEHDIRPVIATGSNSNLGLWAFLVVLAIGGAWLFTALSASRDEGETSSQFTSVEPSGGRIASPEPLRLPDRFSESGPVPRVVEEQTERLAPRILEPRVIPPLSPRPPVPLPEPLPPFPRPIEPAPSPPQVVFENRASPVGGGSGNLGDEASGERVTAGRLANPSHTIPQGTVIPAVLETALDSTRPGGVRALVQRDMFGFDGTQVLIPRGSRLYGEYEAGLQRGQNRALVQWTRLIRPDGVTVALDSPSSDPLGRAGIKGKVDGKFFQRFGNALLQSVLDVGVGLAVNEATDGVIVALPGSTQNVQVSDQDSIRPTLKVKHGTSVSVFVARDLDFSSVDR